MKRMAVAVLALVGVFIATYLALYKMGVIGHLACGLGGCERVNTSRWATLAGLPVAGWGVAFYMLTLLVAVTGTSPAWSGRREISLALVLISGVGLAFSGWLTYLELYVIGAVCRYCVVSAILVTLIFLLSVSDLYSAAPRRSRDEHPLAGIR